MWHVRISSLHKTRRRLASHAISTPVVRRRCFTTDDGFTRLKRPTTRARALESRARGDIARPYRHIYIPRRCGRGGARSPRRARRSARTRRRTRSGGSPVRPLPRVVKRRYIPPSAAPRHLSRARPHLAIQRAMRGVPRQQRSCARPRLSTMLHIVVVERRDPEATRRCEPRARPCAPRRRRGARAPPGTCGRSNKSKSENPKIRIGIQIRKSENPNPNERTPKSSKTCDHTFFFVF